MIVNNRLPVLIKMKLTPDTLYKTLIKHIGNLDWWPIDMDYHKKNRSDSRFEIIVGAILTQNTSWSNVEKALSNLKLKNIKIGMTVMSMILGKTQPWRSGIKWVFLSIC